MSRNLSRVDEQLVHIQVQLKKLQTLVVDLSAPSGAAQDEALLASVRHHRHGMLQMSQALSERIERFCREPHR